MPLTVHAPTVACCATLFSNFDKQLLFDTLVVKITGTVDTGFRTCNSVGTSSLIYRIPTLVYHAVFEDGLDIPNL